MTDKFETRIFMTLGKLRRGRTDVEQAPKFKVIKQINILDSTQAIKATQFQRYYYLIVLLTTSLMSCVAAAVVLPALNNIQEEFGMNESEIDLYISATFIFNGIGPLYWGVFGDRYGRKFITIISLAMLIIFNVLLGFSKNQVSLFLFSCGQIFAFCGAAVLGSGFIINLFNKEELDFALGAYFITPNVGWTVGPIIGGYLDDWFHWRYSIWISTIPVCLLVALIAFTFPESKNTPNTPIPQLSTSLMRRYTDSELTQFIHADNTKQETKKKTTKEGINEVILLLFSPLQVAIFFRSLEAMFVLIATSIAALAINSIFITQTVHLADYKLSSILIGWSYLPMGLGCVVGCFLADKILAVKIILNDRKRKLVYTIISNLILVPVLILDDYFMHPQFPIYSFLGFQLINGFFTTLIIAYMSSHLISLFPKHSGTMSGFFVFMMQLFGFFFSLLRTPIHQLDIYFSVKTLISLVQIVSVSMFVFVLFYIK